jgi:hypothetical protein
MALPKIGVRVRVRGGAATRAAFPEALGWLKRAGSRGLVQPLAGGLNDGSDESVAMAAPQAPKRLLGR